MTRRIGTPALVILVGFAFACEEINHVRVVAPSALVGATVTVRGGEQSAKLIRRSDSTVESDQDIPLPPLAETLVIQRDGCQTITVDVRPTTGRTTVVIRADQVHCALGR